MSYAEGTKTKQVGRFLFLQKYLSTNTGDQEGTLPHLSEMNKKLSEKSSSDCGLVLFVCFSERIMRSQTISKI